MQEQTVMKGMQPFSRMTGGCVVEQITLRTDSECSLLLPLYHGP